MPKVAVGDDDGVEASVDDELLGYLLAVGEAHDGDEGGVWWGEEGGEKVGRERSEKMLEMIQT